MDLSSVTQVVKQYIDKIKKLRESTPGLISLQDQNNSWMTNIAPYRVVTHPTYFTLDKTPNLLKDTEFQTTFHAIDFPEAISGTWLSPILKMPKNYVMSKFIYPTDPEEKIHELKKKEQRANELLQDQQAKGKQQDKQLIRIVEESKLLREALENRADSLLYMSLMIRLTGANSLEELDGNTKDFLRRADSMGNGLTFDEASFRQIQGLQSTLPLGINRLKSMHLFSAYAGRLTFPFYPKFEALDEETGFFLGMNPTTKKLIFIDFKRLKEKLGLDNFNMVLLGTSGGGKSTTIRTMIHRSFHLDPAYFVIDPKSDYTEHARDWGGQVFDFSLEEGTPFNVFERPKNPKGEYVDTVELKIASLKALFAIVCNIRSGLGSSDGRERSLEEDVAKMTLLDEAFQVLYEKYDDGKNITVVLLNTALEGLLNIYSKNSEKHDNEIKALKNLLLSLKPYVTGSSRKLFEVNTSIEKKLDVNNMYTVFNLQRLENAGKEKEIISFMALQYSWNLIRKNIWGNRLPMICIDEAWTLFNNPIVADYILQIFKLARGYGAGIVVATQNAEDLLDTSAGVKVVNLSGINLFLKNNAEAAGKLKSKFSFIDETIAKDLTMLSPGEGYLQLKGQIFKVQQFLDKSWEYRPEYEPAAREAK